MDEGRSAVWSSVSEVDDPVLVPGRRGATRRTALGASPAPKTSPDRPLAPGRLELPPVDLRVVAPRALDVQKLHAIANKPLPPQVMASLGGRIPVLLCHGLTAFALPGRSAPRLWGMGYEVEVAAGGDTLSVEPGTQFIEVARAQQTIQVGLAASGHLGTPEAAATLSDAARLPIPAAEVHASTDQRFALSIQLVFRCVKVEAGPFGTGGAKWNLYVQDEPLNGFQQLLQTLLVRTRAPSLKTKITTWVRTAGIFGLRARQWTSAPMEFDVDLDWTESARGG